MEKILDRLMLAELAEAHDPLFLERHAIQAILYFGEGGLFPEDIKLYHRPTVSGALSDEQLRDGVEFLRESLRAGRRVLVIGPTGATIVAAYLTEVGFSSERALGMVTERRTPRPDLGLLRAHAARLEQRSAASLYGHGRPCSSGI